jgi:3-hydroxy-9,10-secoandrosta-1,3,5(10)-triene-9,17-dione monooxygenase reductase component
MPESSRSNLPEEIDPETFRKVMSSWPTGVAIITTRLEDKRPIGILCNSLTSISLAEQLLLWTVDHASSSHRQWVEAKNWAVHFLADDQQDLIVRFARKGVPNKYEGLDCAISEAGTPILEGVVARLECQTTETVETFDHTIILGKVTSMSSSDRSPIIFAYSKFHEGPKRPS